MIYIEKRLIKQFAFAIIAVYGGFCMGLVSGWSSLAHSKVMKDYGANDKMADWASSVVNLGCAVSVLPIPFLMDSIGRKKTMLILAAGLSIAWIILTCANGIELCIFGRFTTGFFVAGSCILAPIYVGEIVEPKIRGACSSCFQLLVVIGILVEYALGTLLNPLWLQNLVSTCFIIVYVIILLLLPETPTYLIMQKVSEKDIDDVYRILRGPDVDFMEEKNVLKQAIAASQIQTGGRFWNKFQTKSNLKAFFIVLILMFGQQLSGINAVIFFSNDILEAANLGVSANLFTIILGVVQVVATLISVVMVDRAGRKILLYISFMSMASCLLLLGIYFQVKDSVQSSYFAILPLASLNLYIVGFSLGAGPLTWAMQGELLAPEVKATVGSFCTMVNWLIVFGVTFTFLPLNRAITTQGTLWMYAGFNLFFFCLIVIFVIETKNSTLEEIQRKLNM